VPPGYRRKSNCPLLLKIKNRRNRSPVARVGAGRRASGMTGLVLAGKRYVQLGCRESVTNVDFSASTMGA
jgi:hypothetical protein